MKNERIVLALVGIVGLIVLFLGLGGLIAAWKNPGAMDASSAALIGTIAGGTLSLIASVLLGKSSGDLKVRDNQKFGVTCRTTATASAVRRAL